MGGTPLSFSAAIATPFKSIDDAAIVVRDLATGEETELACTPCGHFHVAARQRWCIGGDAVCYQDLLPDGTTCPVIVRLDAPGKVTPLEKLAGGAIRWIMDNDRIGYGSGNLQRNGPLPTPSPTPMRR